MSNDNSNLLTALVQDVLTYIRQEHSVTPSEKKIPQSAPPVQKQKPAPIQEQPILKSQPAPPQEPMRKLIEQVLPQMQIREQIPSDAKARALAQLYKKKSPQVILLSSDADELFFLKALAKAIHEKLAPTKILEAAKFEKVDGLRLIITTHAGIESKAEFKAHFKESPMPLLFEVPLVLLAPPSEYENNHNLKRALWNHLCQLLK